ncbi:uncharacterized protein LOC114241561 [Bombyx mandarina]|uniref:Uncharacterized protein LOC114241561 n=1 Tax=Bombyx mandarina TaxID=7092 RepID=A0A6J2JFF3_BOMMA|nr:uncharacterized protein LOC114241561 [Bombyx mandarina]
MLSQSCHNHQIDVLEIMNEQHSQGSSVAIEDSVKHTAPKETKEQDTCEECPCKAEKDVKNLNSFERLIKEREAQMRKDFEKEMEKEINYLKDRFDFVLQNEQIRAAFMLCEAHREREEKIFALQTQLECKNLAGLMYVLCSERRKCKLEKLKLVEDYTSYINTLQDILMDAQKLILNLSKGYKTAAQVDNEWRVKMNVIMKEFQSFIYNFSGGTPETNQYFFDIPKLLKTETPLMDSTNDPCEDDEVVEEVFEEKVKEEEKPWWERLDGDEVPFVMFGDMADFRPPQRREVLKNIKAAKTAPKRWREYVFNEMLLQSNCPNLNKIKDEYSRNVSTSKRWECQGIQTQDYPSSRMSLMSHRATTQSIDVRGDMGSILKLITSNATGQYAARATLLGARDSMEIASTTKLREKYKNDRHSKVVIKVGERRTPQFDELDGEEFEDDQETSEYPKEDDKDDKNNIKPSHSILGSLHRDSLHVIPNHKPDQDRKINYEKICPANNCKNMKVDSFMDSLPPYMKANPYVHFKQNYEQYETCSPEQLEILKHRIEEKKKKDKIVEGAIEECPLDEWTPSVGGIAVQTSTDSLTPPCTCRAPSPTPASSIQSVVNVKDLFPVKRALNEIDKSCFYDDRIQFDRFKVIGGDGGDNETTQPKSNFKQARFEEIRKILEAHPSLLEIFQANAHC